MNWAYISYEQGEIIEEVCGRYYSADNDCPNCPIKATCKMDLPKGKGRKAAAKRTEIFETALAKAALAARNEAL